MQKNWYAIYTRPGCEKKVARSLLKKGIENFCPVNFRTSQFSRRKTLLQEPLFKSYIFIKAPDNDIINLSKQVPGIFSLLYWLGKPATINEEDIDAIKEFTNKHQEIKLEKLHVNLKADGNIVDDISFNMGEKILKIKNRIVKVNLPSLGFTLVATIEDEGFIGREVFEKRKFLVNY
jgi:transcription antitermination factor NusG